MYVKMAIVLLVAERGQYLTAAVLGDNSGRDFLHDCQEVRTEYWFELQEGVNMVFGHHDDVLGTEPRRRRAEGEGVFGLNQDLDVDQSRDYLGAVPIRFDHTTTLRSSAVFNKAVLQRLSPQSVPPDATCRMLEFGGGWRGRRLRSCPPERRSDHAVRLSP